MQQGGHHRRAMGCGHIDLEAEFAAEAHAEQAHWNPAADLPLDEAHMRQHCRVEIDPLDQAVQNPSRIGALHRDYRKLFGGGGQPQAQFLPFGLEVVLHHIEHPRRAASGGGDMETILGDAGDDAVVDDEAGLVQQDAVAAAAGRQLLPRVDVESLEEFGGVGADDLDLPEGRGVE